MRSHHLMGIGRACSSLAARPSLAVVCRSGLDAAHPGRGAAVFGARPHSWSLSPRSARPRSASSPPWSSATSLISRPVRPCLGHPHPAHRPAPSSPSRTTGSTQPEGPRRAGSAGGARVKGSSNGSSNGRGQPRRKRHSSARDRPRRQHRSGRFAAAEGSCGLACARDGIPRSSVRRLRFMRASARCTHGPDPGVRQDRVEDVGEVRSPVADHEFRPLCLSAKVHKQVAGLLGGGPLPGRVQGRRRGCGCRRVACSITARTWA